MFGMRDRLEELEKRVELLEFKLKGQKVDFTYHWLESGTVKVDVKYLNHYENKIIKDSFPMSIYNDVDIKDNFLIIKQCHYEAYKKVKGQIIKVYQMTELGLDNVDLSLFRKAYPNEV